MRLEDHPTAKRIAAKGNPPPVHAIMDAAELRDLARECGAADVGLVEISRAGLDQQREEILRHYPWTKTLLSFVVRMAREPVRGPEAAIGIFGRRPRHRGAALDEGGQLLHARGVHGEPGHERRGHPGPVPERAAGARMIDAVSKGMTGRAPERAGNRPPAMQDAHR